MDGVSSRKAEDELWNAVEQGRLRAVGIGRQPFRVNNLPKSIAAVPAIRRTGDFTYLRPGNAAFDELNCAFGCRPATITLAFRQSDIERLCSNLRQRRRRTVLRPSDKAKRGRPPLAQLVQPAIVELIDNNGWNASGSLKALARAIERKIGRRVSEETSGRYLDKLFTENGDRKYLRRKKGPSSNL